MGTHETLEAMQAQINTLEALVTGSLQNWNTDRISGRFYLYAGNRWVTSGDDNYGTTYFQFNESGGTGNDPVYEWEHRGILVAPGTVLTGFDIVGDVNNTQVTDVEYVVVERRPDDVAAWDSGFDNDTEMENIVIDRDFFWDHSASPVKTGNINDTHGTFVTLDTPHLFTEYAFLTIYCRPVGNVTGTRYFNADIRYKMNT